MVVIKQENINRKITRDFSYSFLIKESGLYILEITASAKSWPQNLFRLRSFFKDDDLAVKIDGRSFPKLDGRRGLFDGEAAWNGNNLKGLSKTNIIFARLQAGEHVLLFLSGQKPVLEKIAIFAAESNKEISYIPSANNPPQDGNTRQWLNLVFIDLSVKTLNIKAKAQQGAAFFLWKRDDADIKLIIDREIQKNNELKSHPHWYWCGKTLKGERKTFFRDINLSAGRLHYIELWADRMPAAEGIELVLEEAGPPRGRVAICADVSQISWVNLREQPNEESKILAELTNGASVFVEQRGVEGSKPEGLLSDLWHKVLYNNLEGFIHSAFVEFEGQERVKITEEIKLKAKELGVDEKLALNLAHCESKWLPFAHSGTDNKGIYQLGRDTIDEINAKHGGNISDPYDAWQNIDGGLKYLRYLLNKYAKSSDALARAITAWSRGTGRVRFGKKFSIDDQSEGAQILIRCILEEKRGEKILKALGLAAAFAFVGLGLLSSHLHQREAFDYSKQERSVRLSSDYTASFIQAARKGEVILADLEDDFDGDGIFEKIEFGFVSPEEFDYIARLHTPSGETIDMAGLFSEARTLDISSDGVKELILRVKSGKEFGFFIFAYQDGALRQLRTLNNFSDPYEGIWGLGLELEDLDNDGLFELIAHAADYFDGGERQKWYQVFEYYKWNNDGFYKYREEKKFIRPL